MKTLKSITYNLLVIGCSFLLLKCQQNTETFEESEISKPDIDSTLNIEWANGFDFPVGKPNANAYYNAQTFTTNYHLGEDWNGVKGGNSDLGDPIYSVSIGKVVFAEDAGPGWENIIRIHHFLNDSNVIESFYAHCDSILIEKGDWVARGEQIATIGTANGVYLAHLHFEMRNDTSLDIGPGYSSDKIGYLNPTRFINNHRPHR